MQIDQRNNPKLMWMIVGGLIVVIVLITLFFWVNNSTSTTPINDPLSGAIPTKKAEVAAPPVAQSIDQSATSEANHIELVNEKILKDKVPENASLAKEEIAKLDDIQDQLNEQEQSLKSQHEDADQLIKLKEEQIKLLEQQLAAQHK